MTITISTLRSQFLINSRCVLFWKKILMGLINPTEIDKMCAELYTPCLLYLYIKFAIFFVSLIQVYKRESVTITR